MFTTTLDYYKTLSEEDINDEIDILNNASKTDILELIKCDPYHYITILEHYKGHHVITPPVIITRILGNLNIKFEIATCIDGYISTKWLNVGFTDSNLTDKEIIDEFIRTLLYSEKHSENICKEYRKTIMDTELNEVNKLNESNKSDGVNKSNESNIVNKSNEVNKHNESNESNESNELNKYIMITNYLKLYIQSEIFKQKTNVKHDIYTVLRNMNIDEIFNFIVLMFIKY